MARGRLLVIAALALATVAAAPLLGAWALGLAAALVVVAALAAGRGGVALGVAVALGTLGGLAGAASALAALRQYSAVSPYDGRAAVAWAAVALGLAAAAGGALAPARPRLAALLLALGSALGFVAINLFNINTLYFVAPPLCWLAAAIGLVARRPSSPP